MKRRPGQKLGESAYEYLARLVDVLEWEQSKLADSLPTIDAVLDYFDMLAGYDTDDWLGVRDSIASGDFAPDAALKFIRKHKLGVDWKAGVQKAIQEAAAGEK